MSSNSLRCFRLSALSSCLAVLVEAINTGRDTEEASQTGVDAAQRTVDSSLEVGPPVGPFGGLMAPQFQYISSPRASAAYDLSGG